MALHFFCQNKVSHLTKDVEQNSFALLIAFIYARETFYRRVCSLCTFAMGSETVQRRENSKSWTSTQSGKLENRQKE